MAKYKGREVRIVRELSHPTGDQVEVEHMEPGTAGKEIVPVSHVTVSKAEKKAIDDQRAKLTSPNDFRVEGEKYDSPVVLDSVSGIQITKTVKRNTNNYQEPKKAEVKE